MRSLLSFLVVAAIAGAALSAQSAQADDRSPFQLIPAAQVSADGSTAVDVTPVRVGYGWRGYGYYGGWNRPYATYGYYRGPYYGGYYGYRPYYSGYYGYRPYYNAYRGWYGGWY
jgi:hypothetical protein